MWAVVLKFTYFKREISRLNKLSRVKKLHVRIKKNLTKKSIINSDMMKKVPIKINIF